MSQRLWCRSQRLWYPCDFGVTPDPIGLGFEFWTALGLDLGLRGPDLGLGLFNFGLIYI